MLKNKSFLENFGLVETLTDSIAEKISGGELEFKGYGAWRDPNGGQGIYSLLIFGDWDLCSQVCLNSDSCTGVEYATFSNGRTSCELHTGVFGYVEESSTPTAPTVTWVKV